MDPSLLTVASGMKAQIETLEVVGNNIANASTTGYKRDNEFYRLFLTARAQGGFDPGELPWMPFVEGSLIDYQQGALVSTEAPLDIALSGPGFLQVEAPNGRLYTRSGSLTRSADGRLQTADGFPVLDVQEAPINIPPEGEVQIGADGVLRVSGLNIAQIGVIEFEGRPPLTKAGSSYFRAREGVDTLPAVSTAVLQGKLEASNVDAPLSAVRLIIATRNFEALRQAATLISQEMNARGIEELGSYGR